ncbi:DUF4386 domain-containing protein [Nocardia abscessus]|uniref:DUF4386 domain-containing protein n=1 Tax=Nocardia abscessus TaxID=120957 RepID=UPI0024546C00|nr:DUF4386 domain-containing protein [Nocardia abscessus]
MDSPHGLARLTGVLYLIIAVCGFAVPLALGDPDDPVAAAAEIRRHRELFTAGLVGWIVLVLADTAVAVTLYLWLRRADPALAALTAAVRLVYAAMLAAGLVHLAAVLPRRSEHAGPDTATADAISAAALGTFHTGFSLALILFGAHCLGLGALLWRSRAVPRLLAVVVFAAGIGYIADNLTATLAPSADSALGPVLLAPVLLGELGLMFWLLAKGASSADRTVTATA